MVDQDSISIVCHHLADTRQVGLAIAEALRPGMLITLQGTLGAGKTNLVQAIAESLGIDRKTVVSPTFTLVQVHKGRLELVHIDAYRIADEDQYFELGIDEYIDDESVVAIEWAEKFAALLPQDRLSISIDVLDEHKRAISISWPNRHGSLQRAGTEIRNTLTT